MNNLNQEFVNRMKNELSNNDFDRFIKSFNEPYKSGFMLNKKKLFDSCVDIKKLEKDWNLIKNYECDGYIYYIYDRIELENKQIFPGKSIYHHAGLIYIQEPSSNIVLRGIDFINKKVLDLCSAPGGKCIQSAFSGDFSNGTSITANEINNSRKLVLKSNIERVGFYDKINIVSFDPSIGLPDYIKNQKYDIVIIDAPCSGEGMMRKSEIAKTQWSIKLIENLSILQKKIIDSGISVLADGGILSYSTCTYAKEEDEDNVKYILDKYNFMKLLESKKIYHFENIGEGQFYARFEKERNL